MFEKVKICTIRKFPVIWSLVLILSNILWLTEDSHVAQANTELFYLFKFYLLHTVALRLWETYCDQTFNFTSNVIFCGIYVYNEKAATHSERACKLNTLPKWIKRLTVQEYIIRILMKVCRCWLETREFPVSNNYYVMVKPAIKQLK